MVLALSLIAAPVWFFVEVADEVKEGETERFDRGLLLALRSEGDVTDPIGPRWVEEMARDFTALGGVAVLCLLTIAAVGYLVLLKKPKAAAFVAGSILGGLLLSVTLKSLYSRPRPDLVPHLSHAYTSSFPSGHSMLSAAVYLTLGALLARLHSNVLIKAYFLLWALSLTVFVGFSRVYVGVHWPTDVLGGWAAGAAWAALCATVARRLQKSGDLEFPVKTEGETNPASV